MFGYRTRNPRRRLLRLLPMFILLMLGSVTRHGGASYTTVRLAYIVVLVAGAAYAIWRRSTMKSRPIAGPDLGDVAGNPSAPRDASVGSLLAPTPQIRQGWHIDPLNPNGQQYFDGKQFIARRYWDGQNWVND